MSQSGETKDVHRALVSVSELVKKGHRVVMDPEYSYIYTADGTTIPIFVKDGVFVLPVWHDGHF